MNINLVTLKNDLDYEIVIDEQYSFPQADLDKVGILKLKDSYVHGVISKDNLGELNLNLDIVGTMVLPCSRTLKPVDYSFKVNIDDNLAKIIGENGEKVEKTENTIDILPIIWENILVEIPIKIMSDKANDITLKGDGWRLITDKEENINPELAKLKDLL